MVVFEGYGFWGNLAIVGWVIAVAVAISFLAVTLMPLGARAIRERVSPGPSLFDLGF